MLRYSYKDCASLLRLMYTSAFSHQLNIRAGVGLIGNYFNENVSEWEPLIEPVEDDKQVYRHWELNFEVRKAVVTRSEENPGKERPFRCKFMPVVQKPHISSLSVVYMQLRDK